MSESRRAVMEGDDVRVRGRPTAVAQGVPHALDIRDCQLDGREAIPMEAEEEARVEEGRGVLPEEGRAQHPPVLLPLVPAA